MPRLLLALVLLSLSMASLPRPADAQIEIDGLNHYFCHKAKDSKFHPDKFPREPGRDPTTVFAVEVRDRFAGDLFGGIGQLYDFKKYKGLCAPSTKEKIAPGGTAGDGTVFPRVDDALHLVDLQVKTSKKDGFGNATPGGTFEKFPKGTQRRVVTQFYDEVVDLKGAGLALIGADKVDHGPTVKCGSEAECDAIDPALTCHATTKTCLPADPLAGLPGTPRSGPNYLCYKAKQVVKQDPVLILAATQFTDGVTDPDEPLLFSVSKMTRLCLSANKAAENAGAEDSYEHLACFKAKQATKYDDAAKTKFTSATSAFDPGKPPKYKGGSAGIQTFNFGQRVFDLKGSGEFCTPAFVSDVGSDDGIPQCGDGVLYATPGALFEECDDGNTIGGDGCSPTCTTETICGNSITEPPEECDDGNTTNEDGCSDVCVLEFCGDNTTQAGLGEQCDDGNQVSEDGCSDSCIVEFCGDGTTQAGLGEQCDDGNTTSGDGCSDTCVLEFCGDGVHQPLLGEDCDGADDAACPGSCDPTCGCPTGAPPGAFRINSMALADPPFFSGLLDLTGILNALLANAVTLDADPEDGLYDVSLLTLLRPPGGVGTLDLGVADCSFPSPTTCAPQDPGNPLDGFTSTSYASLFTGTCLTHDPTVVGPNNNGVPGVVLNAPVAGADGCAIVAPTDITLNLLGLALPLQQVEVAAAYTGTPATALADGLLIGFLAETDAAAVILPADLPLVGGQPLTNLLRVSERDTGPGGVLGWWFHLNFTAEGATWTGP